MAPGKKSSTTCDYLAKMRGQLRELSHLLWRRALVTSQTELNLTLVILVDSFLCLYHSTPKVKFVFLQLNSNLFRYEEVQRVSGLLLITNIFELISSLFFTTGPSYARECCLWGFQSTNHFSTQNEWNIHYKATERGDKIKMEKNI